jgi:hypothetical protein
MIDVSHKSDLPTRYCYNLMTSREKRNCTQNSMSINIDELFISQQKAQEVVNKQIIIYNTVYGFLIVE